MQNIKLAILLILTFLVLPALVYPDSEEFRVNKMGQISSYSPAVAMSPEGEFIITWQWYYSEDGLRARKYDRFADPYGGEFVISSGPGYFDQNQSIAMHTMDEFIVVWECTYQHFCAVYAKKYPDNGDSEFKVREQDVHAYPSFGMDGEGNFVIVYEDKSGSYYGIFAKKYDRECNFVRSFKVNSDTPCGRRFPSVAMNNSGNFIVTWESSGDQDGSFHRIYAKLYDKNADPVTDEFQVNTYQPNSQGSPAVAMADNGDFVIAWESSDDTGSGIYAQLFDSSGKMKGREYLVNTYTENGQTRPSVAMDSIGDFVVAWTSGWDWIDPSSGQDGSCSGIYAQRYDFNGNAIGEEFQVNTNTYGDQNFPTVAMDSDGDFVIAWSSPQEEFPEYSQVCARHYQINPVTNEPSVDIYANGTTFKPIHWVRIFVTVDCRYAGSVDMYACIPLAGNYFWYPVWDNTPHPTVFDNEKREDIIAELILSELPVRPIGTYTFYAAITEHGNIGHILGYDSVTITIE